jgi:hypothetical protein
MATVISQARVVLSCAIHQQHNRTIEVFDLQADIEMLDMNIPADKRRPGWSKWRDSHRVQVGYLHCGACCQPAEIIPVD